MKIQIRDPGSRSPQRVAPPAVRDAAPRTLTAPPALGPPIKRSAVACARDRGLALVHRCASRMARVSARRRACRRAAGCRGRPARQHTRSWYCPVRLVAISVRLGSLRKRKALGSLSASAWVFIDGGGKEVGRILPPLDVPRRIDAVLDQQDGENVLRRTRHVGDAEARHTTCRWRSPRGAGRWCKRR